MLGSRCVHRVESASNRSGEKNPNKQQRKTDPITIPIEGKAPLDSGVPDARPRVHIRALKDAGDAGAKSLRCLYACVAGSQRFTGRDVLYNRSVCATFPQMVAIQSSPRSERNDHGEILQTDIAESPSAPTG